MKNKVLLYDDVARYGDTYINALDGLKDFKKFFSVDRMEHEDFTREMATLNERQKNLASEKEWKFSSSVFDETAIFIIDRNLIEQSDIKTFLTGDIVAYPVRCFSECGLILEYEIGKSEFDLTLKGNPDSFADLNVTSKDLINPGLWGKKTRGFRPWYWPILPDYLNSFQENIKDGTNNLENPVLGVLGIPDEVVKICPQSVIEFIGGDDPIKTTFREFVEKSGNGLNARDRRATKDKDDETITKAIGRIAAARISKWLEWLVLPGQDILVDAPHLVSRCPSLLKGKISDIRIWNKTTNFSTFENLGLSHEKIEKFRFKKDHWLSRPTWFWRGISEYQKIEEMAEPWKKEETPYVFCEDGSLFYKREKCKEFISESDSPYLRRSVFGFDNVEYRPKSRLF